LRPSLRRYVTAVIAAGTIVLIVLRPQFHAASLPDIVFFVLLAFITEMMPVSLPFGGATISVGFVVVYASILLFGPRESSWIAALGTLRLKDLTGKVKPHVVLFNRALLAICAGATGLVFLWTGGRPYLSSPPRSILPIALCGLTYITVNTVLMVGVMSIEQQVAPWRMFLTNFRWMLPNLIVFQPLGAFLAQVYLAEGKPGVALLIVPLLVARHSFQLYIKMRKVYLETIMMLTASLDAKDPSTFGHSERVSNYAAEIGKKMGFEDDKVDLLRYVGVLHDIGKVGIRDAVLKKPGVFTPREYEEMKQHPLIGAKIISAIRLLGDAADWVKHHHERYEGTGFPDHLKGDSIPLGARIIAVADALDAITSIRPYKSPMSWELALAEMQRCSGTQFDPGVVATLMVVAESLRSKYASISGVEVQQAVKEAAAAEGDAAAKDARASNDAAGTEEATPR
jgi:putative nucleotidyltransferase with HDIG domain